MFLTRVVGRGPPNAVYTVGDIDLHPHIMHSHFLLRAVTRTQGTPTRVSAASSDLISLLHKYVDFGSFKNLVFFILEVIFSFENINCY